MGPEIGTAPPIASSPLLTVGKVGGEVPIDRTNENLFIKGWWSDIVSHLFIVLSCKMMNRGLWYPFKIVNESEIFNVRMGLYAYGSRPKGKRDEVQVFNTLSDFIGGDFELVIIRLGSAGHKNRALPGYFREALTTRTMISKPTWIIEEPDSIFGPGHFAYDESVGDFVSNNFTPVDLTTGRSEPIVPRGVEGSELQSEEGLVIDDGRANPVKAVMPKERVVIPDKEPTQRMDTSDPLLFGGARVTRRMASGEVTAHEGPTSFSHRLWWDPAS
jgi:hypothetical protein